MGDPLASKLSELFIILADNYLQRLIGKILSSFDHTGSLDEEAKSSNDRFLAMGWVTDHLSDDLTHGIGGGLDIVLTIPQLVYFQLILKSAALIIPYLVDELDTLLADPSVRVCSPQDDGEDQCRQGAMHYI
jgi:hypothetical protein